jgi:hypothetical protein
MGQGFGGSISGWMGFKRNLGLLPPSSTAIADYSRYRIPRPAVPMEGETPPGLICWGTVGDLPSPQQLPNVDFNTKKSEEHVEQKRESTLIRVENPDDPGQYIEVERADWILFLTTKQRSWPGPNTATEEPPAIEEKYEEPRQLSFRATGGSGGPTQEKTSTKVTYTYPAGDVGA